jgi:chromosome segregation ATPase
MTTDGEGAQGGAEGTQSGAGDNTSGQNNGGEGTNSGTSGGQSDAQSTSELAQLQADLQKQRERTQAADKRAAEHEAALKQLRDKDLPEQQKLQRDLQAATEANTALQETNKSLALKVAFLTDNAFTWHNPERALRLADLSSVEVAEDGTVTGLKQALEALAKSDAYLLKTEATTTEENKPPAGTAAGNNGSNGTGKPAAKALSARFPGLNTRVKR